MEYFDIFFAVEPAPADLALLVSCNEMPRGMGVGTYWHGLVSADNYDLISPAAGKRDADSVQAKAWYQKPGASNLPVHTYGLKRMRDKTSGHIHPLFAVNNMGEGKKWSLTSN